MTLLVTIDRNTPTKRCSKYEQLLPATCVPLELATGTGAALVSLDRVDCSRGYTQDNVVLACRAANTARGDLSIEEFEIFVEMVRKALNQR